MSQDKAGSSRYAILVCIFCALGGLFFGYDQGVTGGVLVMDSFLEDFCIGYKGDNKTCDPDNDSTPEWDDFISMFNVTYYIGCIFGAFLAGIICDFKGRRVTVFTASFLFIVGTFWVIFSPAGSHGVALAGRVVEGMGVGMASFSCPVFNAEMAPKHLRGMLSGMMQLTVVTGLLLAGIVNIIVEDAANGWRITNGVATVAPAVVMVGIFFMPESPRWLYKAKGRDAAKEVLLKLRDSDDVDNELNAIGEALQAEGAGRPYIESYREVLSPTIRKRLFVAVILQLLQQATGINPMFTYGGLIFEQVATGGIISLLILQIVNFLSTFPALHWVDRYGRRSLLLIGAVGMFIGHVVSGLAFTFGCDGDTDETNCSSFSGWLMIVFTAIFIFNFAISWGPVCWIYPAEIFPLHVRSTAVSLSTMMNWTMGTAMMFIPKLFDALNINGVFFLFAALCICCGVFVYFFCPETKNVLLEDIEAIFNGTLTSEEAAQNRIVHESSKAQELGAAYAENKTPKVLN